MNASHSGACANTSSGASARLSKTRTHRTEPEISWDYTPRLEPGEYPAIARSSSIYWDKQFKRWVCAVQFEILDDSRTQLIARLTWYLNMGTREKPRAGKRGRYWAAWVKANGGSPKRGDRLTFRSVEGRAAIVKVEDTAKTHDQRTICAQQSYSVVRDVLRWESGAPHR